MIQVTERARETFKNKLELIERPDVMLRIGRTDSGLGVFPDTLKDDDQIFEHDGCAVLLIDHEVSETLADTTIDVEEHIATNSANVFMCQPSCGTPSLVRVSGQPPWRREET